MFSSSLLAAQTLGPFRGDDSWRGQNVLWLFNIKLVRTVKRDELVTNRRRGTFYSTCVSTLRLYKSRFSKNIYINKQVNKVLHFYQTNLNLMSSLNT